MLLLLGARTGCRQSTEPRWLVSPKQLAGSFFWGSLVSSILYPFCLPSLHSAGIHACTGLDGQLVRFSQLWKAPCPDRDDGQCAQASKYYCRDGAKPVRG